METIYKSLDCLQVGNLHKSNSHGNVEILGRFKKENGQYRYHVRFLNTGFEKAFAASHIISGSIVDKTVPSFFNKGYLGEGVYKTSKNNKPTREAKVWINMLQRCYSKQYHNLCPSYKNVSVCDRWLNFQNFCEDLPKLENYDLWINDNLYSLDKDLKQINKTNKIYSLETCIFISSSENTKISNISKNLYKAIDPFGKEYFFENQNDFAKEHNLDRRGISSVVTKVQKTHKGWFFEKLTNS